MKVPRITSCVCVPPERSLHSELGKPHLLTHMTPPRCYCKYQKTHKSLQSKNIFLFSDTIITVQFLGVITDFNVCHDVRPKLPQSGELLFVQQVEVFYSSFIATVNVIIIIPLCLSAQSRGATKETANFVHTGKLLAIRETLQSGVRLVCCRHSSHQHCNNKLQENEMIPASSCAALASRWCRATISKSSPLGHAMERKLLMLYSFFFCPSSKGTIMEQALLITPKEFEACTNSPSPFHSAACASPLPPAVSPSFSLHHCAASLRPKSVAQITSSWNLE